MTFDPHNADPLIPTRDSLLSRLKDWQDDASWRDFFNTYWRLIYGVARKAGLSDQEAEEVVQETLITVARRIPEFAYDRNTCTFKTWLMNLTRWRIIDQVRKRRPTDAANVTNVADPGLNEMNQGGSGAAVASIASTEGLEAVWDDEWRRHLLAAAVQKVKLKVNPAHYQIFHLCVFKERPLKQVAAEMGVGLAQVYLAKHRVGAELKREIKRLDSRMSQQFS